MKKLLAIFVAAFELLAVLLPTVSPQEVVEATVTVAEFCELSVDPSSIDFGFLAVNITSGNETVTLENTGNTDITLLDVWGTDWLGTFPNLMPVGQTEYDDGSGFDDLEDSLTPEPVFGGFLADGTSDDVDFRVTIPDDQPADDYSQTITFDFDCNGE